MSTYKEEVTLKEPKPQVGGLKTMFVAFGGANNKSVYYKNINEKRFSNQTEIQGKRFLVKDKLPEHKWEMSTETKNIGTYTCYKVSYSKEVENKYVTFKNGESVLEIKKETILITAWYTTQVFVSKGPDNYQGLPGLMLEVNDGKTTVVFIAIILNPSQKNKIQEPKKGKVGSQEKFTKIEKQKSHELMEKFKGRNGVDFGSDTNIKMGG